MSLTSPSVQRDTPPHPVLIAVVASLAAFMEVLDTTITNVSLSHIAGSLAASQDESTWVLTSYLVANGIVLPLSGWLANVLGRKNFFLLCIGGFTLSSLACGLAESLPMLIIFRLLQGLAGGGLQPMQQAIVMDAFPPQKRGLAFAITGITMVVAPILGPTLGGYITDNFSWRWIFFINVPVGILAALLVRELVTDPPHAEARGKGKVDFIGLGLVALGLGALQIVLDKGQEEDWFASGFIVTFAVISGTAMLTGIWWLLRQKDPMVNLRLMRDKYFGPSCVMIFFVGFTLYGAATLLPMMLQSQFGYDALMAGLVLSPSGLAVICMMMLVGRLVSKIQARYLVVCGTAVMAFGMWETMHFTPQTDYGTFVYMRILQVLGLPLLFVPVSTLAFSTIPKEQTGKASALYSLMRNLGGSFGISLVLTFANRREQLHQTYLASHLAPSDTAYQTALATTSHAIANAGLPHATATAAGKIYQTLVAQATMLAYGDSFALFGLIALGLGIFGFIFLPRNKPHGKHDAETAPAH